MGKIYRAYRLQVTFEAVVLRGCSIRVHQHRLSRWSLDVHTAVGDFDRKGLGFFR